MVTLSMVVGLGPTQCSRLLRLRSAVTGRMALRRLIRQSLVGGRVQGSLALAGGLRLAALLAVLLLLIQISHHIVNCLDRATELALQANVHDVHVDVDGVVAVVSLHIQELLLAANAVLLR